MNKNEIIELKHIQLEIQNNRAQHFRHFVDQYFCYKNGYVTKSGKASWGKIPWNEYVSYEASKTRNKKKVIEKEHVVPLKVIEIKLLELGEDVTLEGIQKVLDRYLRFATITKEQDKILNRNGLKKKMPNGFYEAESELFDDVFARYKVTGIKITKNDKTANSSQDH